MKRKRLSQRRWVLLFLLAWVNTILPTSELVSASSAGYPIVVWFQPGIVRLPHGQTMSAAEDAAISSGDVSLLIEDFGVDSIGVSVPTFTLGDTLATSYTGESVHQFDWSSVYTLIPGAGTDVDSLLAALNQMPNYIIHAEPVAEPVFCAAPTYPSDPYFRNGNQWGMWNYGQEVGGARDADVDAPEAWGYKTGNDSINIAIIDNGVTSVHPEFTGRMFSQTDPTWESDGGHPGHGFLVAGVAAATGNNGRGIAGMDWQAKLISEDITGYDKYPESTVPAAIESGIKRFARVMNHSYQLRDSLINQTLNSWAVGQAIADAYRAGVVNVAAMGNVSNGLTGAQFPASYPQGVIAVGATTAQDTHSSDSMVGAAIDVSAPGENIKSTTPCDSSDCSVPSEHYAIASGTSLAAPFVTGIASLLLAKDSSLYNDDVENIIELSADSIGTAGWHQDTGWGRANARRALQLLNAPNILARGSWSQIGHGTPEVHQTTCGGWIVAPRPYFPVNLGATNAWRDTVYIHASFTAGTFHHTPHVWGRGVATTGWNGNTSGTNPNYGTGFCDVAPGRAIDSTGCWLRTFVYEFDYYNGSRLYWPCRPESVQLAWSGLEVPPGVAEPNSFFVPQSDDGEGTPAVFASFRTCPDLDGTQVLKRHARIEVVVRNAYGDGIPNIAASDIFVLLNGGTQFQGYIGEGADTILASTSLTTYTHCPDLRAIMADGPTDGAGTTYITFIGAGGVRDSTRKWGNVNADMPVYVLGTKMAGQLTTNGTHGSYALRIRNVNAGGYYGTDWRYLEKVTSLSLNWLQAHPWWEDFDANGLINILDTNFWKAHNGHDCRHPTEY